jgi:hypothetical protein
MKKLLPYILILTIITSFLFTFSETKASVINPNEPCVNDPVTTKITNQPCIQANYNFLAPLPIEVNFDPTKEGGGDLGKYLNVMIKVFIGVCAVLAVVMIVIGGLEYMTNELVSEKADGKNKIKGAIFGLILALGAYTILYTINPALLDTSLSSLENVTVEVALEEQIKSYTGQGKCEPVTSGICTPGNLEAAGFPNGTQASSICNGESKGNPSLPSGVDRCSDGNSFSYGLFQINILAHANEIPGGVCSDIFQTKGSGTQGSCLESKNGICIKYDCSVKNQAKYQSCVNYITNPTNNIKYAVALQKSRDWNQWGAYSSCRSTFPPK